MTAPSSRRTEQPGRARLLDLPAELRQLILTCALHDAAGIHVTDERIETCAVLKTLQSLLLVSHSVAAEAIAVFASCNTFRTDNASGLLFLLRFAGPHGRPQLRRADVVFARPTGRGFVDGEALRDALALLNTCPPPRRFKLTVELALRAVQAPWNHAHENEREHCTHYPRSAKNKAGKNWWIHPVSVGDTPYAEELGELVQRAGKVRWEGSPQLSWSSWEGDEAGGFVRESEEWLRGCAGGGGVEFVCEWERVVRAVEERVGREKRPERGDAAAERTNAAA